MVSWRLLVLFFCGGMATATFGAPVSVTVLGGDGRPLPSAMVTLRPVGDSPPGFVRPEVTRFTGPGGSVVIPSTSAKFVIRLRKPEHSDFTSGPVSGGFQHTLQPERDPLKAAEARPANAWMAAMDFGGDEDLRGHFKLQCAYCHQQGSAVARADRTEEQWGAIVERMVTMGSRLDSDAQKRMPALLSSGFKKLRARPNSIPHARPWDAHLARATITEWPLGSATSQFHDLIVAKNGLVYIGDNTQDKLYELDPQTGKLRIFDVPHEPGDRVGGNMRGLMMFPGNGATIGVHSLHESPRDGHFFMTNSIGGKISEFDPKTGKFAIYALPQGFYPHTIRFDQKDRVWFTLAVSNQVAMFDRQTKQFKFYDLPARSFMERLTIWLLPAVWKMVGWGIRVDRLFPVKRNSEGVPQPYGIDITPDGAVWFSRVWADDIGRIDPGTGEIRMIKTPFRAPRRLRVDDTGRLWITSFVEAKISQYDPATGTFTQYDLPTEPKGSDAAYSLVIDSKRRRLWVTPVHSDTLLTFDMDAKTWKVYPTPHRVTFARDGDLDRDGNFYAANSNFPGWHIEGGQPTLMRISP